MFAKQFEDLQVWNRSRLLNKKVYKLAATTLISRDYGLRDQVQRASISIMLNIAEGFDSGTNKAFQNFLKYSFRSSSELKAAIYIALDLNYINVNQCEEILKELTELQRMLKSFIKYLNK